MRALKCAAGLCVVLAVPCSSSAQSFCGPVTEEVLVDPIVLGDGTPGSVSTADIQNALDTGGHIRFNVGSSPTTITLTAPLSITRAVVLDGGGLVTLSGGNARRIVEIAAQPSVGYAITLQNLTFANGSMLTGRGGAIYNITGGFWQRVSLKLVNCAFTDNAAMPSGQDDGGGALYLTGLLDVRIGNCTFTNNTGSNGGAVYTLGTRQVTIVDSVFTGNSATGTDGNPGNGGNAGAFGVDGADRLVDVCRTRFVDNTSNAHGAGFFSVMYDSTSRSRFEDTTFDGNRQLSSATGEHTGGAYIQDGPFALERVSFLRNEARAYGGLFVTGTRAAGTIRNSTFVGNVVPGLGAAMSIGSTSPVSIVNTTIANNVSTENFAAGIATGSLNQLTLTNVILANNTGGNAFVSWGVNNTAAFDGGGNMQWPQNRPNGGAEVPASSGVTFADPLLAATDAQNGGYVPTLALTPASPARDTGVSGGAVPATDARGVARSGAPDRGSYEVATPAISIGDASLAEGDGGTGVLSFTVSLSFASSETVTVAFDTEDGTATAGSDYVAASGILTFAPGTMTQSVAVTVNGDTADEPPGGAGETFFVNLSAATNATLLDGQGRGAILNDDAPPGPPALDVVPGGAITVGGTATLTGANFTPGTVIKLFVNTGGAIQDVSGPGFTPSAVTFNSLTWNVPATVSLGEGFGSIFVVNTDQGFTTSNTVYTLLYGDAADNIPTITSIDGTALETTLDPGVPVAHADVVVSPAATVTIGGTGFNNPGVNLFGALDAGADPAPSATPCAVSNYGPVFPGGEPTSFAFTLPGMPAGPLNVQVVNDPYTGNVQSNSVSAVAGARPAIASVSVSGDEVTVMGSGFSCLSVINLFNQQGASVVNLGGLTGGGQRVVPLQFVSASELRFMRPAGAVAGPAFVEVLNPPYIPFSSSGNDPEGGFSLP